MKRTDKYKRCFITILLATLALSLICVGCGSSGNDTGDIPAETTEAKEVEEVIEEEVIEAETAETETIETEELSSKEGKSNIDIAELMVSLQEVPDMPYTLDSSQSDFITEHINLFPAGKDDLEELYSYYDPELDYVHMKKNPQRYCGEFAYLEHLQVVEAAETSLTDGEYNYFTVFNALTSDPESCFIYYVGKSVDAVEGDYISAVVMPIDNSSYEVLNGGARTTIVMLASIIENDNSLDLLADFSSGAYTQNESINSGNSSNDGDYILPESDSRYYSADELSDMSKDDLRIARNEIYARHGRIFDSADLDEYFRSKSWYNPTTPAAQFNENVLNDYEKKNAATIQSVENGGSSGSSSFDGTSIYGSYSRYDSNRGIEYDVEVGFYTEPDYDFIHFSTPYHSGDNIYTGRLDQVDGNVYLATDTDGTLRITFQSDGSMKVEVTNNHSGILDQLAGTYDLVSRLDLRHVG